jgi:hypothetical protein
MSDLTVVTATKPGREALLAECAASVADAGLTHLVGVDKHLEGPAGVRNLLAELVSTPWVVFLDDDDLLYPHYERTVAPHFDYSDMVYTGWDLEGAEDPQPMALDPFLLSWRNTIPVTACVRTEVFRAVGGFPVDHRLEDHGLWKAILLAWDAEHRRCRYRITYEPAVAWRYRRLPGSRTEEMACAEGA